MWLIRIVENKNIKFYFLKKYNDKTFILKTIKVLDKKNNSCLQFNH